MKSDVIARVAAQIVAATMKSAPQIEHATFRVKNLLPEEVVAFTGAWNEIAKCNPSLEKVDLLVAGTMAGLVDQKYVAEGTVTYSRNNNHNGLVYLETEDQSDAQGLANFFTLRDGNFLDGSFDDANGLGKIAEIIAQEAWAVQNHASSPPKLYIRAVANVIELVNPELLIVPVRKYIQFCIETAKKWVSKSSIVDADEAREIVGASLPYLDMFVDHDWRCDTDQKTLRRLELNFRYADLRGSSGDIDPDSVIDTLDRKEFKDLSGQPFEVSDNQAWRDLCALYLRSPSQQLLGTIPFYIFAQLFKKDVVGVLLGDLVANEIAGEYPERLQEFENLSVQQGLNNKQQHEAERFLAANPEISTLSKLSDLIPRKTRRVIEKLAYPKPKEFENPLLETVRQLNGFQQDAQGIARLKLQVNLSDANEDHLLGLFTFLYGGTLSEIVDLTSESSSCIFDVSEELLTSKPLPKLRADDEGVDEEGTRELDWSTEAMQFRWLAYDAKNNLVDSSEIFIWRPKSIEHLALFWLLSCDEGSPIFTQIGPCVAGLEMIESGEDWYQPFVQRISSLEAIPVGGGSYRHGANAITDGLIADRKSLQSSLVSNGITIAALDDYFDIWVRRISEVRANHVPNGARLPLVDSILMADSIAFGTGRLITLPTHPHKLRWIAEFYKYCKKLLLSCLNGDAVFATSDPDAYIDWLSERSPRELPPVQIDLNAELLFSSSECSWFEEFNKLSGDALFVDDPASIDSITKKIGSYVDAHPYKKDGLSILLISPPSDKTAAEVIANLFKTVLKDAGKLNCTVACTRERWESVARAVERAHFNSDENSNQQLFPSCQLDFIDYEIGMQPEVVFEGKSFDISVCISLLNSGMQIQQNTEDPLNTPGAFHTLFDQPTTMVAVGDTGASSIVMKPANTDPSIEDWGTMAVRSNRARPVAPNAQGNVDFVELRQNFSICASLFNHLHICSHWVITLERHISRRQIESVEAGAPDVLSISGGIGANGTGTLVVSSRSGRSYIESRLKRKLEKLIPQDEQGSVNVEKLAAAIYDETRITSPHLALSAMGISRVTEEILGLAVARSVAEIVYPVETTNGFSIWLSLDEHAAWFGGVGSTRADLVRLSFRADLAGELEIDVLVLEGKLRQSYDLHGISQASQTSWFFKQVLGTDDEDDSRSKIDSELWREKIYNALELCAEQGKMGYSAIGVSSEIQEVVLKREIHDKFRRGSYRLAKLNSLYSCCLWDDSSSNISVDTVDDVLTVRMPGSYIYKLVSRSGEVEELLLKSLGQKSNLGREPSAGASEDELPKGKEFSAPVLPVGAEQIVTSPPVVRKKMPDSELASLYMTVLDCFDQYGVSVNRALDGDNPYVEGPASILFRLKPGLGTDPKKLFERADSLKLALGLENEQSIAFGIDKGYVTIDVPKSQDQRYFVSADEMWSHWQRSSTDLTAPVGENTFGEIVSINFSSANSPHLLIGGTTGSGKSEALNTILFGLSRFYTADELRLFLVDPKGTELVAFEGSDHLEGAIGWDDEDAKSILERAVDEMQNRYAKFKLAGARSLPEYNLKVAGAEKLPWWLIVLDEYADLTSDPQAKKDIEAMLKRLAQKARAAGIHLIIATQKPSAEVISTNLRSNLPSQLALRVRSAIESRVIMDCTGAESLNGKGDAFLRTEGKTTRIQCARV